MTLSDLSDLAQILGSLGVIFSLIFVALELRKNTAQSRLANYGDMVNRFMSVFSMTNDPELAKLVARGRKSYVDLADDEKISYGYYLENICIAFEGLLHYDRAVVHKAGESRGMFNRHIRYQLGFPGAREWFDWFERERGFPSTLMKAIHEALDEEPAQ